jgi:hypothetical protein
MADADPVVIDDGGSTRIKRLFLGAGIGEMDKLLDVDALTDPTGTRGSSDTINSDYSKLLIVCQDRTGASFSMSFASFTTVTIASGLNQNVRCKNLTTKLNITIFSASNDPIVESKQHKKKRRYIVSNSGPIETVSVNGTVKYDTSDDTKLPAGAERPIIYTSVVIT